MLLDPEGVWLGVLGKLQHKAVVGCNAGRELQGPITLTQEEQLSLTTTCINQKPHHTYLAQGNGASSEANESSFPAVGVLGERKLLGQDLDHVFDLGCVVLSHKLSHQPGERMGKHKGIFRFWLIQPLRGLVTDTGTFSQNKHQEKQY